MSDLSTIIADLLNAPAKNQSLFTAFIHSDPRLAAAADAASKLTDIVNDVEAGKTSAELMATFVKHGPDITAIINDIKQEPIPDNIKNALDSDLVKEALDVFPWFLSFIAKHSTAA